MGKLCGALLLLLRLVPCETQDTPITGVLAASADLSVLYTAVRLANLNFILEGIGPFTVFAPTNDAFRLLGPGITTTLTQLENTAYLTQVLQYHVCYGDTLSQNFLPNQELSTFQGVTLKVTSITPFRVNDIPISRQDIPATNGLVHTIGKVMIPPGFVLPAPTMDLVQLVQSESYLSTLAEAIKLTGLETTLTEGPLTVLMPTNTAFAALGNGVVSSLVLAPNLAKLRQVLLHHVLKGSQDTTRLQAGTTLMTEAAGQILITQSDPLKVDSRSTAISADVPATNGLLHVVDTVLLPSGFVYPDKNLLELVQQSPTLSIFAAAIKAAGLENTLNGRLSGDTRYTLFAPTNDAFQALGIGVATSLLMPTNQVKLYQIVRYHLLSGPYERSEFTANTAVQTMEQSLLKISSVSPLVVDNVGTTTTDIPATNGVMHMLSGVLLPIGFRFPDKSVVQVAESTTELSTLVSLVLLAELKDQLSMNGPFTVFAPTDAAFAALGQETLEMLQKSENRQLLQKVLMYHVISGRTDSTYLRYGRDIATLEGSSISVKPWTELGWKGIAYQEFQPPVTINADVQVSTENVLATNGIVHFVNKVLLPPGVEVVAPTGVGTRLVFASITIKAASWAGPMAILFHVWLHCLSGV